jgi:hypothetical protein
MSTPLPNNNNTSKQAFTKKTAIVLGLSAFALFATSARAADAPVQVQPVPLAQEGRVIPGFGNEGLIVTRYTVKADGTTDDIEIVGGFTNPFYENAIKDAIAKWTFTPGTVNGAPADFLNQEYAFRVKISEQLASSPDFQEEYEKLNVAVTEQDFDDARKIVRNMLRQKVHTVLDYAVANQELSKIEVQAEDLFAALEAVKKATLGNVDQAGAMEYMLTPQLLEGALRQQLILAAGIHQHGEVLRTWETLNANFTIPADDRLHAVVAASQQKVDSPDPLPALGKIINDEWTYQPVHRIFTVADIAGELDTITARCEHRNLELEYQPDVDWTLPAAVGKCMLDFEGDDGTTFTIYEFKE